MFTSVLLGDVFSVYISATRGMYLVFTSVGIYSLVFYFRLHHQKSRYVYDLFYKRKAISRGGFICVKVSRGGFIRDNWWVYVDMCTAVFHTHCKQMATHSVLQMPHLLSAGTLP